MFHFNNNCLNSLHISCLFSGGIKISPTFLETTSGTGHGFKAISIPISSPIASAVLWATFLEVVFAASNPAFVAVSNIFFPYLSGRFLMKDKNPYPWTE